jgi:hypothetical protein
LSTDVHFAASIDTAPLADQLELFDLATLHLFSNVSRRDISHHQTLQTAIQELRITNPSDRTPLPSLRDALSAFGPEPHAQDYQICQRCHSHYALNQELPGVSPEVTSTCTHVNLRSLRVNVAPCGNELVNNRGQPIVRFRYFPIVSFIGALLSVSFLESAIDATTAKMQALTMQAPPTWVSDIAESAFVRNFTLPGASSAFMAPSGSTPVLKLMFNVFIDFFNSEGQRIRGKKASTGLISLHCVNLPGHLRHLFPHICALIEGPFEPGSVELQNYIEILVDDILRGSESGYTLTHTANHPEGRQVEWAIAIHIADLVASRASMGFVNHNGRVFCAYCNAWDVRTKDGQLGRRNFSGPDGRRIRQWKELLGRIDWEAWLMRDNAQMMRSATEYRNNLSYEHRQEIWALQGLRWAEWWRIPYFDMVHQAPIEPAHVLLLGVVQWLIRRALKMSDLDAERQPKKEKAFDMDSFQLPEAAMLGWTEEKRKQVIRIMDKLTTWLQPDDDDDDLLEDQLIYHDIIIFSEDQLRKALSSHTKSVLDAVLSALVEGYNAARGDSVGTSYTIADIVQDLINWVRQKQLECQQIYDNICSAWINRCEIWNLTYKIALSPHQPWHTSAGSFLR